MVFKAKRLEPITKGVNIDRRSRTKLSWGERKNYERKLRRKISEIEIKLGVCASWKMKEEVSRRWVSTL